MTSKKVWVAMIVITIIAFYGGYYFASKDNLGASGTRFPNGISADTTSPIVGQVRGTTLAVTSSANIITAANATSSLTTGCIITYATSSATSIRIFFTGNGGNSASTTNGGVFWGFGSTCPQAGN